MGKRTFPLGPLAASAIVLLAGCGGGSDAPRINDSSDATVQLSTDRSAITQGQAVTLTWASANADSCRAAGAWTGQRDTEGSETLILDLTGQVRFELTCSNESSTSGASTATVSVGERVPALVEFDAVRPDIVRVGDPIVFTWQSSNASSCLAEGPIDISGTWSGRRASIGFEEVITPDTPGNYVYELTCDGETLSDTTEQVTIQVSPSITREPGPKITFTSRPDNEVQQGQPLEIQWEAPGAAQCSGASFPEDERWNRLFSPSNFSFETIAGAPQNYVYSLSCTDSEGASTVENVLFSVRPAGPVVKMAFEDGQDVQMVPFNTPASFSWNVDTNAVECTASSEDPRWSQVFQIDFKSALTGTFQASNLNPGVYSYNLSCEDRNGNTGINDSVRLVVGSPPAPSGQFTLDHQVVDDQIGIDWATINANRCEPYSETWEAWRQMTPEMDGVSGPVEVQLPDFASGTFPLDATLICSGDNNEQGSFSKAFNLSVTEVDGQPVKEAVGPTTVLSASASRVVPGAALSLAWNSNEAVTCTIPNTVNQDWKESQIDLQGSKAVIAPQEPGVYTYSVSCSGSDFNVRSTASTYVVVGNVQPSIDRFTASTTQALSGDTLDFEWEARNALFCETGQSGVGEWSGLFEHSPAGNQSVTLPRIVDSSRYDFALTCGIPGGPKTSELISVTAEGVGNECGILEDNAVSRYLTNDLVDVKVRSIFGDGAPVIITDNEGVMSENAINNIIDGDASTSARLIMPLGLGGLFQAYVDVYARPPLANLDALTRGLGENKRIGFVLSNPNQALQLSLLGLDSLSQITAVPVSDDGSVGVETGQRDFSNSDGLTLNALFLVNDIQSSFVSFPLDETNNFAGVRYAMEGGLLGIAKTVDFSGACVSGEL